MLSRLTMVTDDTYHYYYALKASKKLWLIVSRIRWRGSHRPSHRSFWSCRAGLPPGRTGGAALIRRLVIVVYGRFSSALSPSNSSKATRPWFGMPGPLQPWPRPLRHIRHFAFHRKSSSTRSVHHLLSVRLTFRCISQVSHLLQHFVDCSTFGAFRFPTVHLFDAS